MNNIEEKLKARGLTLPDAPMPAANYVPFVVVGDMVYISGQISQTDTGLITGKLGADLEIEQGVQAARQCALALIAQLKRACDGDLSRLKRIVKLTGFVNSTPDFTNQPQVINGCSDLMVDLFGDSGRHARSAVSAASLPLGVAVEIEAVCQIT